MAGVTCAQLLQSVETLLRDGLQPLQGKQGVVLLYPVSRLYAKIREGRLGPRQS